MNVLIIEDEKPLANALFAKCVQAGLNPSLAADGQEGLHAALSQKPDIILLDLIMPKMNGIDFMHALRTDPWGAQVPIIVLTNAPADSADLVKAIVAGGPEFYLVKSDWNIDDIIKKVKEVLANHYGAR